MSGERISPARRRILGMLHQQGPLHRHAVGEAFSKSRRGMTTQAATRLAGYLCRPLIDRGLIVESHDKQGFHRDLRITKAGIAAYLAEVSTDVG